MSKALTLTELLSELAALHELYEDEDDLQVYWDEVESAVPDRSRELHDHPRAV